MKYDKGNIFYRILNESIYRKNWVLNTKKFIVINDIQKIGYKHYLFIPKENIIHLFENPNSSFEMIKVAKRLWDIFSYKKIVTGYKIYFNGLQAGGQVVPHLHMHLIFYSDSDKKADEII